MSVLRNVQPVSEGHFIHCRLKKAIIRLWARADGHSHLGGANQIVGISIIVGMRIFSIGGC